MQYHLNGFSPGDPTDFGRKPALTERTDVLIIGGGPAGLTLAAQLSAFEGLSTRIIERKAGPLEFGQADGIACRSVEMFEAFGFAERVLREAYHVNEVAFWRPNLSGHGLHRADRIQDVEDDLSEMPHVILSQARVHDFFLDLMRKAASPVIPEYGSELISLRYTGDESYPVTAQIREINTNTLTEVQARYVVGCDGARSTVRRFLGYDLQGTAARQLWG